VDVGWNNKITKRRGAGSPNGRTGRCGEYFVCLPAWICLLTLYPLSVAAGETGYNRISPAGPGYVFAAVEPANPTVCPFFSIDFLYHFLKSPADWISKYFVVVERNH
jgi:hypothetical protein